MTFYEKDGTKAIKSSNQNYNNQNNSKKEKNIVLARHAGFCYGVKRAVDTTIKLKENSPQKDICVLGELIHNSQVISKLNALGVKTVDKLPLSTECVIIRSHGEKETTFNEIQKRGFELVDLTCFDVKKVQNNAVELAKNGYFVIILGKIEHPEVMAIESYAKNAAKDEDSIFVANDLASLKKIEQKIKTAQKVGVVLQTTQTIEFLLEAARYLSSITHHLKILNTICPSTKLRQEEAKNLAKVSDLMIVVGSKNSANTTHLAKLLEKITNTIHIETDIELDNNKTYKDIITNSQNIGITAGASTPNDIIQHVVKKIEDINKNIN